MVRKRLADLLRQEAEKSPNSTPVPDELYNQQPPAEAEETSPMTTPTSPKRTALTKADLEVQVTELQAEIDSQKALIEKLQASSGQSDQRPSEEHTEATGQKEILLQQQVADLQSEVEHQKAHIQQLQAYLDQTSQLKAELESAKVELETLKQHKSSLPKIFHRPTNEEMQALTQAKTEREAVKKPNYPTARIYHRPTNEEMQAMDKAKTEREAVEGPSLPTAKIYHRPTNEEMQALAQKKGDSSSSTATSDQDIGWFD